MKASFVLLLPIMAQAANYTSEALTVEGIPVIRLADASHKTEVMIVPSVGNNSYEMKVNGKRVFWSPYNSVAEFKAKPVNLGNPFLAPWANRLEADSFYANGKKYILNPALNSFRYDGNHKPIHGMVMYSPDWKVVNVKASEKGAEVTSRLEFWRHPDWMAQFPFAHNIDMTYRLQDGILEVETVLDNQSTEPMPVGIGYHPYFTLHDAPRDAWEVHMPVKEHLVLSSVLIPTGETKPMEFSDPQPLAGTQLDDVFGGLIRGSDGRAEFSVQGLKEKISVFYGPKFPIAVVYAPKGRDFICFEPMSGPTNVFNMAQAGTYKGLQSVPAGSKWRGSFWIQPSGF
ncbi:MAG: aldose 1-epimerase [Bryobacteraceae bacterium]